MGQTNDKFEKEADSVADKVVNKNAEPNVQKAPAPPIQTMKVGPTDLQKMSEPEEDVQMERESESDNEVQPKRIQRIEMGADEDESVQLESEDQSDSEVQLKSDDDSDIQTMSEEIDTMSASDVQTKSEDDSDVQLISDDDSDVQTMSAEENEVQTAPAEASEVRMMEKGSEEEPVQMMSEEIDTMSASDVQAKSEDDSDVQLMSDDDSDIQTMPEENEVQAMSAEASEVQTASAEASEGRTKFKKDRKNKQNNVASNLKSSKGGGSKMDSDTQAQMESGFGTDLSGVNIHTDSKSVEMNQDLGSKAFTNGADIYFNEGQYDPGSKEGQTLLAHELTHTLQQGAVEPGKMSRKEKRAARKEARAEKKADRKTARAERKSAKQEVKLEKEEVKAVVKATKAAEKAKKKEDKKKEKEEKKAEKKAKRNPKEDPDFLAVTQQLAVESKKQTKHEPAKQLQDAAQEAAPIADNEVLGTAQEDQVEEMSETPPQEFDAVAFKAKVMDAIAEMEMPESEEEADDFDKHTNVDEINAGLQSDVSEEQAQAAGPVVEVSEKDPDTGSAEKRKVAKLKQPKKGKKPKKVDTAGAVPKPRPESEVSKPLADDASEMDRKMAENDVTDEQLANSEEPSFIAGLDEKKTAKKNAEEAPKALRQQEQGILEGNAAKTQGKSEEELQAMNMMRGSSIKKVVGDQKATGEKDTSEREKVANDINGIYETTKTDVHKILDDLDSWVSYVFEKGAGVARYKFEKYCSSEMSKYKWNRYGNPAGGIIWLWDAAAGLPDEVNEIYVDGRQVYLNWMDKLVTRIANHVAKELTRAKQRVEDGKQKVTDYVDGLDPKLKQVGKEAAAEINDKFEELNEDVSSKQDDLVDMIAEEYMASLEEVDARIEEMKEANKGLIAKAMDMINGIIETIKKLKQVITDMLSAIASVIGIIMADPIGFMGMLFDGIGKGFDMFKANIQKHLLGGLLEWLTGSLGPMGIQMPDDIFSLSGVFDLTLQVLGLGWDYIKLKAVKMMGEPVVNALMTGFTMFKVFATEGAMGIWKYVKDKFQDIKSMVIDAIKDMLIAKVLEAGIKWLLSLLIPGAGFIKAIMAIKDIIVFFVESAIMLIPAITEAILALARGDIAGVAKAMEFGLAKLITLVIGLFARLIGLNGLAKKVGKIFKKIRKRIDRAIRKLLMKAKKAARKLFRKKKKKKGKGDEKEDPRSDKEKKKDLHSGVMEATKFVKSGDKRKKEIDKKFKHLEGKYLLKDLSLVHEKEDKEGNKKVHVLGKVNPEEEGPTINWNVNDETDLTEDEKNKLRRYQGGNETIQKIDKFKKAGQEDNRRGAIKEVRVLMSLGDDIIFVGMNITSDGHKILFESDIHSSIKKFTELDIVTSSEMIEIKSKGFGTKASLSGKNREQFGKHRDIRNGKENIYDEKGARIDLSDRKLVLQVETQKISPRILAEIKINQFHDEVRLGNGTVINIHSLNSVKKASKLKGKLPVSNADQFNKLV
ncbi:MAG: hypothetical protein Crog4KO_05910 [Crocinitomicaceae bacterium]